MKTFTGVLIFWSILLSIARATLGLPQAADLWTFDDPVDPTATEIGEDPVFAGTHEPVLGINEQDGEARNAEGSCGKATLLR